MKVIGFANKFYTLWEVTKETKDLGNGRSYLIFMDNQFDPNQHRTYETTGINLFAQ